MGDKTDGLWETNATFFQGKGDATSKESERASHKLGQFERD